MTLVFRKYDFKKNVALQFFKVTTPPSIRTVWDTLKIKIHTDDMLPKVFSRNFRDTFLREQRSTH